MQNDFSFYFVFSLLTRLLRQARGQWAAFLALPFAWAYPLGLGVAALVAHFFVKPNDTQPVTLRGALRTLALILLSLGLAVYVAPHWPAIAQWLALYTGFPQAWAIVNLVMIVALAACLLLFILSKFCARQPNNKSMLNARQKYFVSYMVFLSVAALCLIYLIDDAAMVRVVTQIYLVLEVVNIIFWFYDPVIYILSCFLRIKPKPALEPTPGKLNRFAIIGCAHNEEAVIANLIHSINRSEYPRSRFDVYVICDNCTDNTAQVVRQAGAIAMERTDTEKRGKGYALEWMFDILDHKRHKGQQYDAYIILDADNVVNQAFLDEINTALNDGHEILQAYLGCKNPGDTLVSKCYSLAYWLSNANFQEAHTRLGLSCQMGGTGMVLRPCVLDEIGWETGSLTEDLVLTTKYVLRKNRACVWVHNARIYDEKPLKLKPSIVQRTRWMQGHMNTMFTYGTRLFLSGTRHLSMKQLDMMFYLMRPLLNLMMFAAYLIRLIGMAFVPSSFFNYTFLFTDNTAVLLMATYLMMQVYVLVHENYLRYALWLPLQYIFTYSWYPAIFRGLVKWKESFWVSTAHARNLDISEIAENQALDKAKEALSGLSGLSQLPLGEILLRATVINKEQLMSALAYQKEHGGYLGDVMVRLGYLPEETLKAYLQIQEQSRATALEEDKGNPQDNIIHVLLKCHLATQAQVDEALAFQKLHKGRIGQCLNAIGAFSPELWDCLSQLYEMLKPSALGPDRYVKLLDRILLGGTDALLQAFLAGGLVNQQQIIFTTTKYTHEHLMTGLVELGFLDSRLVDMAGRLEGVVAQEKAQALTAKGVAL